MKKASRSRYIVGYSASVFAKTGWKIVGELFYTRGAALNFLTAAKYQGSKTKVAAVRSTPYPELARVAGKCWMQPKVDAATKSAEFKKSSLEAK